MMCEHARGSMAAAWANELNPHDELQLREHLQSCSECSADMLEMTATWNRLADLPTPEPSQAMSSRFHAALDQMTPRQIPQHQRFTWSLPWQLGMAAACLMAGVLLGNHWQRGGEELERLRQEVASTRAMVAVSLLQQQSAVERLRGVDYSQGAPMDSSVIGALVQVVNNDRSVNVRLAAIEALTRVSQNVHVRESMTKSLGEQESPMVQAALINYFVDTRDRDAAASLRRFAGRTDLNPAIRERATSAVAQLTQYK